MKKLDHGFVVSWDELFISLAMLEKAFTNPKDKAPKKKVCFIYNYQFAVHPVRNSHYIITFYSKELV